MDREIRKFYFDLRADVANDVFFECKNGLHYMLTPSACSYIPEMHVGFISGTEAVYFMTSRAAIHFRFKKNMTQHGAFRD